MNIEISTLFAGPLVLQRKMGLEADHNDYYRLPNVCLLGVKKMTDWWTIVSIISGPILAVQAQKWIERAHEARLRKVNIFRTLMLTRDPLSRGSIEHVQALNQIDIEYYGRRFPLCTHKTKAEKDVILSWKEYLKHLNTMTQSRGVDGNIPQEVLSKSEELLMSLLAKMAQSLGYNFNEDALRLGIYKPELFFRNAQFNQSIQQSISDVLEGKKSISVKITDSQPQK